MGGTRLSRRLPFDWNWLKICLLAIMHSQLLFHYEDKRRTLLLSNEIINNYAPQIDYNYYILILKKTTNCNKNLFISRNSIIQ